MGLDLRGALVPPRISLLPPQPCCSGLPFENSLFSNFHMPQPVKPLALRPGDAVRILSSSSPVEECLLTKGCTEVGAAWDMPLRSTTKQPWLVRAISRDRRSTRLAALQEAFAEPASRAILCSRGGYGSNYLLEGLSVAALVAQNSVGT